MVVQGPQGSEGVHFLHPDGTLPQDIMPDYLHLTPLGYQIWAIAIEAKLRELLDEQP
jgi:lysophospholipase L1-like esterase